MYYYQQIDEIGKEVAVISSSREITDTLHYRVVSKEYYDAVVGFLHSLAQTESEE